jgi:hypothetical protein
VSCRSKTNERPLRGPSRISKMTRIVSLRMSGRTPLPHLRRYPYSHRGHRPPPAETTGGERSSEPISVTLEVVRRTCTVVTRRSKKRAAHRRKAVSFRIIHPSANVRMQFDMKKGDNDGVSQHTPRSLIAEAVPEPMKQPASHAVSMDRIRNS